MIALDRTFAVENFFSVPTTAPLLCAAFKALLPLIVVSRCAAPGPRTLLPILVTFSQSSDMMVVLGSMDVVEECWCSREAIYKKVGYSLA